MGSWSIQMPAQREGLGGHVSTQLGTGTELPWCWQRQGLRSWARQWGATASPLLSSRVDKTSPASSRWTRRLGWMCSSHTPLSNSGLCQSVPDTTALSHPWLWLWGPEGPGAGSSPQPAGRAAGPARGAGSRSLYCFPTCPSYKGPNGFS